MLITHPGQLSRSFPSSAPPPSELNLDVPNLDDLDNNNKHKNVDLGDNMDSSVFGADPNLVGFGDRLDMNGIDVVSGLPLSITIDEDFEQDAHAAGTSYITSESK